MAPYHTLDNQGMPKQRPMVSTKTAPEMLSVRKDSHNAVKPAAAAAPPYRRDWQAGPMTGTMKQAAAPTIRVIHIFAPKVIKTDMANFRSTVQKLTGRSTKKRGRSARTKSSSELGVAVHPLNHPTPSPAVTGGNFTSGLWDQERRSPEEVLQRLVGDACGTNNILVRSNSVESSSYSMDSGNFSSDSNETTDGLPSPTATDSFSFYVPHRESAYSLSEIPAPFFGVDMHPCYNTTSPSFLSHGGGEHGLGLQLPTPVMESMLSFDVDNIGSGLGSPLPLSDTVGCDTVPFPVLGCDNSSSRGLYDMLSVQQHCRLSVQQPTFQGGNFFEMI
ncbi:hypothetical protein M758_7G159700 [Ceratodon purpureus]|nr:hypothetical protein KC19_N014900 [Ceratodon purpureus]KAG0611703.1 hypothetical protein M758_7G159700 [Ceratodon purpureus]